MSEDGLLFETLIKDAQRIEAKLEADDLNKILFLFEIVFARIGNPIGRALVMERIIIAYSKVNHVIFEDLEDIKNFIEQELKENLD